MDPHEFVRAGLRALVNAEPDMVVCGESDVVDFVPAGIAQACPEVVLIGASPRRQESVAVISTVHALWPKLRIIAMSMSEGPETRGELLAAGAADFVVKVGIGEEVLAKIRRVRSDSGLGKARAAVPPNARPRDDQLPLTAIERQIAGLLGHGMPTHAIATRLRLPLSTIEAHLVQIREKLQLNTPVELVEFCVKWDRRQQRSTD